MRAMAALSSASLLPLPHYASVADSLLAVLAPFAASAASALAAREAWVRAITAGWGRGRPGMATSKDEGEENACH